MKLAKMLLAAALLAAVSCTKADDRKDDPVPTPAELDFDNLRHDITASDVYTSGVKLSYGYTVMQSFDLDPGDGYIYFTQVGGSTKYYANHLSRRKLGETAPHDAGLKLPYFGHGQGLAVEMENGKTWCWLGCHGTHCDDDVYRYAQTIARFEYKTGTLLPEQCESYYWIPDRCNLQISLDKPGDVAMIYCISLDLAKAYIYGYSLSGMKELTPSEVTLPMQRRFGGPDENQPSEVKEYTKVKAKDLSSLRPLFSFELPSQCRDAQGYACRDGKNYVTKGLPEENGQGGWNNSWTLYVLDFDGKLLDTVELDSHIQENSVKSVFSTDFGYFEPEGIQVRGSRLYQGFAYRKSDGQGSALRLPAILEYDLSK